MATSAQPTLARNAVMMILLMFASVMVAGVTAEIPDGDGITGIDRNPGASEQDGADITRTLDGVTVQSKDKITIDRGMMMTAAGDTTTGSNTYAMSASAWTATGETVAGDGPVQHNPTASSVRSNNIGVTATSLGGTGGGVEVVVTDASDGSGGDSITMTLQNWYGAVDRSTAHGLGTSTKGAGLLGCTGASANPVMQCALNHDSNGIDVELPTTILMYPNEGSNTFSYGIGAAVNSAPMFFGIDYTVPHNVSVVINGVTEEVGNTKSVSIMDDVVLRCSDANCQNSDIQLGIPGAYNSSGIGMLGGDDTMENYNTTARLSIYDKTTVKLTFGTATEHQANITAENGVFYDPSIRFMADEPSIRIGQIEDGGASWCDAWWFLAKCGDSLSFDGNAANGMDGMILHYKVPLEVLYSQASWGGYDQVKLVLHHSYAKQCFNGDIQTYVVPESDIGNFQTKNSLLKYATTGDYYTMTEPTSAYASGTTRVGTSTTDYCFGDTTSAASTEVDIGRITQMTSASPYSEYMNGFYDLDSQMYEFYVVISIEASTALNANNDAVLDEFAIDTGAGMAADDGTAPQVTLENTAARDPLANFGADETRTTNSTNQTNPAFASLYAMFYSGITPSDNIIAGRNLTDDDFGTRYQGLQNDEQVRKPTGVNIYGGTPNYDNTGYAQTNTTPLSTIECGGASFGGSPVSMTIDIFTSVDTSLYFGAGQNGSGYPTETTWKEYGTLSTNSSRWVMDSPSSNSNWDVDNDESNTGSNIVSFTGVFINGDNYKATCSYVYHSDDIGAGNVTTTTVTESFYFTAAYDGAYVGSGGSDVADDDDGIFEDFDAYDFLIIGIAVALIGLGLYMWSSGSGINSWFDDRLAMMLLGVAILHAWVAVFFGPGGADWFIDGMTGDDGSLTEDWALAIGTLGYMVMALSAYLWGNAGSGAGERNFRFALGGVYLIVMGVPTALTGLLNVENEFLEEAMWTFPVYEAVAALGAFVGVILLGSAAASLYRRDGM